MVYLHLDEMPMRNISQVMNRSQSICYESIVPACSILDAPENCHRIRSKIFIAYSQLQLFLDKFEKTSSRNCCTQFQSWYRDEFDWS